MAALRRSGYAGVLVCVPCAPSRGTGVANARLFGEIVGVEPSIVLAEDEADLRTVYAEALRQGGYEVCEAADGGEALGLVEQHRPALLILDLWMPVLNGFEVLEKLRDVSFTSGMRVVMLSNASDADSRLEGFASGVSDYWVKDLSLVDLLANVRRVLEAGVLPGPG